jgi:hypothetical protein
MRARDQCCIVPMVQLGSTHRRAACGRCGATSYWCENSTGNTFAAANRCPASQAGTRVDLGASGTSGAIALIVLLK